MKKILIVSFITLFYVIDVSAILLSSYLLFDEIKSYFSPVRLPSMLNISGLNIAIFWIVSVVIFITITILIIKNNKKRINKRI